MKVRLPNLNTLRAIAALMVFWNHFEMYCFDAGVGSLWPLPAINQLGKLGVILFFVLSGFLITHLLFEEEKAFGDIDVRKFYLRRMLRIWPLYYLVVILGYFIIPLITSIYNPAATEVLYNHFWLKIILLVLILPNLSDAIFGHRFLPSFNQTWSIAVEEQFYLFWPLLFRKFKKNRLLPIVIISFGYLSAKALSNLLPDSIYKLMLKHFLYLFPIDCIGIGAAAAIFYHTSKGKLLKLLFSKTCQWVVLLTTVALIINGTYLPHFQFELFAVLFAILVLNFALNKDCIFMMENAWTGYLGKVSYGFYMFHCLVLKLMILLLNNFGTLSRFYLLTTSFLLTLLLSAFSYHFFESRFLRKKIRYSRIITGDTVH